MTTPATANPSTFSTSSSSASSNSASSNSTPSNSAPSSNSGQKRSNLSALDDKLSKRFIELDPNGYFLIYVDREADLLCAKHFTNIINDKGLACDPETGKPLSVRGGTMRQAEQLFTGRTAKELCMKIFEDKENGCPISYLDHAAYLGREFVRAEIALIEGTEYVQD